MRKKKKLIKRCIECNSELVDDVRFGFFDTGDRVIYCPNKKCSRFGLQTWVWKEERKEEK